MFTPPAHHHHHHHTTLKVPCPHHESPQHVVSTACLAAREEIILRNVKSVFFFFFTMLLHIQAAMSPHTVTHVGPGAGGCRDRFKNKRHAQEKFYTVMVFPLFLLLLVFLSSFFSPPQAKSPEYALHTEEGENIEGNATEHRQKEHSQPRSSA